ncbi:MAG: 4-hydroxy-tetrahydrodipicolinate synthase [Tissierellia bacterium]|nr:4-hydroxy-tetrahydrodipicolinate synthase [Tissierellia bacterium]
MSLFVGSGVAIVTPFDEDNNINYEKLNELIEFQLENQTDAIIIAGTTGEAATMDEKEHVELVRYTVEKVNKRVPVIAGAGGNNTKKAIRLSKEFEKIGVDGLLHVTPYYNKTTKEGLYRHFKEIAQSVKTPIMLYNVPSRTNMNIPVDVVKRLSEFENIVAIKDATGDLSYAQSLRVEVPNIDIYSGNDDLIVPLLSIGAKGVVSVLANIKPKQTHDIVKSYLDGDVEKASKLQLEYYKLIKALFKETNPIPVKKALNIMGFEVGSLRLPLIDASKEVEEELRELLDD